MKRKTTCNILCIQMKEAYPSTDLIFQPRWQKVWQKAYWFIHRSLNSDLLSSCYVPGKILEQNLYTSEERQIVIQKKKKPKKHRTYILDNYQTNKQKKNTNEFNSIFKSRSFKCQANYLKMLQS